MAVKRRGWTLLGMYLLSGLAVAQSTADGAVVNGVYTNRYFKRSFTLPSWLRAVDVASLRIDATASRDELLLMAARKKDTPYGMVMVAERLHVGAHPITDELDFLRRVRATAGPGAAVIAQRAVTTKGGQVLQVLEYKTGPEFDAGVVSRSGDFLLVWKCNAQSQTDLDGMLASLATLRAVP